MNVRVAAMLLATGFAAGFCGCSLVTVPVKTAGSIVTTTVKTTGDIVTAPFDAIGRKAASKKVDESNHDWENGQDEGQ